MKGLPFFYRDNDNSIEKIFYSGNEFRILLFDIITYSFFDVLIDSTLISIILCYIFDKCFEAFREWLGQRNISQKTLIDDKFLI